jgi:hypothetical protein
MIKIHGNKNFNSNLFVDPSIFDFVKEWSIEDKKLAAKNLFFAVQKHLNNESFYSIEDLIQTLLLAIFEKYKKNKDIKPTYVPLICLCAKRLFFEKVKFISHELTFPIDSIGKLLTHKGNAADYSDVLDIKITLEKKLTQNEYDIFMDVVSGGMTMDEILKKHQTTTHYVKTIRKKVLKMFKE